MTYKKAKVEVGVQVVERWILARLRHFQFFSLMDLNMEIRRLLEDLNQRPFKRLPGSRKSTFEALDRPALTDIATRATPEDEREWGVRRWRIEVEQVFGDSIPTLT